ncbi:hypothetical protein [Lentibacillus cibarius]|uniref:Uncharacterized protein n=1 Tax=Lentibacillus cibarius TaxID=2583219 RepID=A0A5S3QJ08_9BACI|nr:hypothetical protein [Lentibacillus cibarius]TMN21709.1 hypothetical protein FFL34_05965 [Lentibacillus cibarius]
MNMNERLRQKMNKRGPREAKEFGSQYRENACNFSASEYEKAEKRVREFRENKNKMREPAKI